MVEARSAISAVTRYDRVWMLLHTEGEVGLEMVGYALADEHMVHQKVADLRVEEDPWLQMLFTAEKPFVEVDMRLQPLADQKQVEISGNRTGIRSRCFSW
ncbi:MAG: hypothetical protein GY822_27770 [Deltaproteobacteria bacterium]|nr:hypothetical protein [Deltaproteobacteria bacterium]